MLGSYELRAAGDGGQDTSGGTIEDAGRYRTTTVPTIPGWIEQWYGNVPAAWNVNENRPFGATLPESNPFTSEVEVWEIESVFVQVTVVPAAIFSSPGRKAPLLSELAPAGMVTDDGAVTGVGVGDVVGDGEAGDGESLPPQLMADTRMAKRTARRVDKMDSPSLKSGSIDVDGIGGAAEAPEARRFQIT